MTKRASGARRAPTPVARRAAASASLAVLLVAAPARGGDAGVPPPDPWQDLISPDRPGAANPPTVVGAGVFQVETAFESQTAHPPGAPSATTLDVPALLRFGVGHDLEFRLESNTFRHSSGSSGFADVSVEAKWCPIGGATGGALAFLPSLTLPTRTEFSAGMAQASLAALGGWTLASGTSFALDADAGRVVDDSGNGYEWRLDTQAACEVPLRRDWAVSGDAFVSDPLQTGADAAWGADAAVEYFPDPDVQLDVIVSRTFTDPQAATSFQLGFSWRRRPSRPPR